MKASQWLQSLMVALCVVGWGSVRAAEEENLVRNAGFEDVKNPMVDWRVNPAGPVAAKVITAAQEGDVHSGKQAISMTDIADKKMGLFYSLSTVQVQEGDQLDLGAWVKGAGQVGIGCFEYGDGKFLRTASAPSIAMTGQWQEITWSWKPSAGVKSVLLVLILPEKEGQPLGSAVVDDAYCRKAAKQ